MLGYYWSISTAQFSVQQLQFNTRTLAAPLKPFLETKKKKMKNNSNDNNNKKERNEKAHRSHLNAKIAAEPNDTVMKNERKQIEPIQCYDEANELKKYTAHKIRNRKCVLCVPFTFFNQRAQ